MIENGIITLNEINGVKFIVDLIPKTNTTARPAYPMIATSITIHNTGNSSKSADAKRHTEYVDTLTQYVSWHFTVDDKVIYQELPITENAWHAGDGGNGTGNRKSIGIEICENEGIDWEKAKQNAAKLVNYLMDQVASIKGIWPHQHWNGKYCPHIILDEGWDKFMNLIESEKMDEITIFKDFNQIPDWAKEDIKQAKERGIVKGDSNGNLNPSAMITRLEAIVIVNRAYSELLKKIK